MSFFRFYMILPSQKKNLYTYFENIMNGKTKAVRLILQQLRPDQLPIVYCPTPETEDDLKKPETADKNQFQTNMTHDTADMERKDVERKEFNLMHFHPEWIDLNEQCLFIGSRGNGKTTAMKSLFLNLMKRHRMRGMVYASPGHVKSWSRIVPQEYVHPVYMKSSWEYLMTERDHHCLCVIDQTNRFLNRTIPDLFQNNRMYQVTLFVSAQTGTELPIDAGGSCTSLFLFAGLNEHELKRIHRYYCGICFQNWRQFKACYDQVTAGPLGTALFIQRRPNNRYTIAQWHPLIIDTHEQANIIDAPELRSKEKEKDKEGGHDDVDTELEEEEEEEEESKKDEKQPTPAPPSSPAVPSAAAAHPLPHHTPVPAPSTSSLCENHVISSIISTLFAPIRLCMG